MPVCQHIAHSIELEAGTELLASVAERRRSTFASRAAAAASLRAKHPYSAFDPLAFDAFLADGLRPLDDANGSVHLSCAPATEAAVFRFAAREAVATLFHRLHVIRAPTMVACGVDTGTQFMWLPEGSKQAADAMGDYAVHTQYVEGWCCNRCCALRCVPCVHTNFSTGLLHWSTWVP